MGYGCFCDIGKSLFRLLKHLLVAGVVVGAGEIVQNRKNALCDLKKIDFYFWGWAVELL
jgi:hypothetical protein